MDKFSDNFVVKREICDDEYECKNEYTLKELKNIGGSTDRKWFYITENMLKELKKYHPRDEFRNETDRIENIKVSHIGEIKFIYNDGSIDEIQKNIDPDDKGGNPILKKFTKNKDFEVHRIAANAFLGDRPLCYKGVSYEIHHIDGNYYRNTPENLIYLRKCEHCYIHNKSYINKDKRCRSCKIYQNNFINHK